MKKRTISRCLQEIEENMDLLVSTMTELCRTRASQLEESASWMLVAKLVARNKACCASAEAMLLQFLDDNEALIAHRDSILLERHTGD